ncbi:1-phosphofructokinase [Moraxella sp. K1664]|uniref:Phosphofructokinase n=1 Tax=Moraxella lacunata TaxID=477 RepID=A0A1B8PXP1_MORLA|nr:MULTISPECIES: 1-phosphofructokinase [Moraxella]MBE9579190.1 1-phosphofructokinase [Moraxella sp. K1664]MDH9219158.1 1-phosphofructokinase [Moraxella lacunata]MDI4483871.1 1-phosphofructokinase [Moraxella lacunata]MDI4508294.1 1-phosphofructokinase [Moraxella lacunata]OBX59925.1 hypothetical protein A9Z63_10135 [Moraxella lacunata]
MTQVLCITLNPAIDLTVSLDELKLGAVNRAVSSQMDAAGKGLNGAQILADLGVDTVATGFLGGDNDGIFNRLFGEREALNHSENLGQVVDNFVRVAGITRTNIKLTDDYYGIGRTTDVNGQGFVVTETDKLHFFEQVAQLAPTCDAVLIAGSLATGFGLSDFDHLLTVLTDIHDKVAVDVSGEALKIAMRYPLWLIKPNTDELTEVFGVPVESLDEQVALFDEIHSDIEHIFVSMGERGVHWLRRHGETRELYRAVPPTMKIKSTVGAGDTFVAGMIFGLLANDEPQTALVRATALSAHAVSIIGFKVPEQDVLNDLIEQVAVEKLA